jgi:hypothetical protein
MDMSGCTIKRGKGMTSESSLCIHAAIQFNVPWAGEGQIFLVASVLI